MAIGWSPKHKEQYPLGDLTPAQIPALKKQDGGHLSKLALLVLTIVVLGGSYLVMQKLPNDFGKLEKTMKVFVEHEDKALAVYKLPQDATPEQQLPMLQSGIDNWHTCDSALNIIAQLKIDPKYKPPYDQLKQYVQLRLQTYRLRMEDIQSGTENNRAAYDELIDRINALIDDLNKKQAR